MMKKELKEMLKALRTIIVFLVLLLCQDVLAQTTWNDGTFEYSTKFVQSSSVTTDLTDNEVAVRLYLGESMAGQSDTISYLTTTSVKESTGISDIDKKKADYSNIKEGIRYVYLGQINMNANSDKLYYFFRREYLDETTKKYSKATDVVIPAKVTHPQTGVEYKVVGVQKWGLCYEKSDINPYKVCLDGGEPQMQYNNINDHRNDFLTTVRFEMPSNVRYIGDYAFMSCRALQSVVIPNSVEYLGQGLFECDKSLTDVRFQTVTDQSDPKYGQVRFSKIYNWTFWFCTGLKTLELPDGITEIEGATKGGATQYMTSLTSIRLPNTLQKVGSHFLCCATSLKTLTIPASVTSIDAAAFHGCESLENVYLLGQAASLKKTDSGTANTFGHNAALCADKVSDCTFWTTADYYNSYASDETWKEIKQPNNNGNDLKEIEPEMRSFEAGKWVTAIFPNGVLNYKSSPTEDGNGGFGATARVAKLESVRVDENIGTLYHMTFKLIDGDDIPKALPVMICPSETGSHTMYTNADAQTEEFKKEMTQPHAIKVVADNGGVINMNGKYIDEQLMPWDFYFMSNKFWRVSSIDNAPKIKQCRCYWHLDVSGVKEDIGEARAAMFTSGDPTTIEFADVDAPRFVVDAIYDMNGKKLYIPESELPQGLFIVNGKKVLKK